MDNPTIVDEEDIPLAKIIMKIIMTIIMTITVHGILAC